MHPMSLPKFGPRPKERLPAAACPAGWAPSWPHRPARRRGRAPTLQVGGQTRQLLGPKHCEPCLGEGSGYADGLRDKKGSWTACVFRACVACVFRACAGAPAKGSKLEGLLCCLLGAIPALAMEVVQVLGHGHGSPKPAPAAFRAVAPLHCRPCRRFWPRERQRSEPPPLPSRLGSACDAPAARAPAPYWRAWRLWP